jgi:aminoglycoside phosphotransferase (APT) family kinase protein
MEDRATLEAGLRAFLARQLDVDDVVLGEIRRHIEGFSWETWEMTARWESGGATHGRRLIARRVPKAGLVGPYDATAQWRLARALWPIPGIPVPEALWLDPDGAATGRPLFFLEHVRGEVPAPWNAHTYFADEAERIRLGRRLVEILATIHRVELSRLPDGLRGDDDPDPTAEVRHWEDVYRRDTAEPVPVLERGFGWLARHAGDISGHRGLVHGDFRIGNAIVADGEVVAMLDWELAHVGDPVEDLANFASRLYRGRLKIPSGLLTLEQLLAAYGEAAGWPVSPDALRFWLVFGSVRSAVSFVTAAALFASGRTNDLRYAAFSRQLPFLLRHVMADLSSDD